MKRNHDFIHIMYLHWLHWTFSLVNYLYDYTLSLHLSQKYFTLKILNLSNKVLIF